MKKKTLILFPLLALSIGAITGCGGNSGGGGDPQDPLDLGPEFNANYYPNKQDNIVKSLCDGKKKTITVALNFEGTEPGWVKLGQEYSRLSGNWVDVSIKTFTSTQIYQQNLQQQESNPKTEWDIVSGNLLSDSENNAINLVGIENKRNPYMANKYWNTALTTTAYQGDSTHMLNTENLLTAWFVNTAATTEAQIDEEDVCPTTWEGLLDNLAKLKQAGYNYPLGLSFTDDSVTGSQFAWLLRVYGDYYFRHNYTCLSSTFLYPEKTETGEFQYDPTDIDIESKNCSRSISRMINTMISETSPYFVGPTSSIYERFINQFYQLKEYIHPSSAGYEFKTIRSQFEGQTLGKDSPQIILDYSGKGIQFKASDKLKNNLDYFDYPKMSDQDVASNTVVRDVGGSGGYLSILTSRTSQLDLDKDFLKFVLSPYGQSIYYKALEEAGLAPQGLTTVKEDLVVIPSTWKSFFHDPKITNTGIADRNKYLTYGVLGLDKVNYLGDTTATIMWQKLMGLSATQTTYTVEQYNEDWLSLLNNAWVNKVAPNRGWDVNAVSDGNFSNPNIIGTI